MIDPARHDETARECDAQTLGDLLHDRAQRSPDRVAFRFPVRDAVRELTYGELERRARAVASYLAATHAPRAPVLVMCSDEEDYIVALMGCLLSAAIPVPAPPIDARRVQATLPRVSVIARDSGATVALCSDDFAAPRGFSVPFEVVRIGDAVAAAAGEGDRRSALTPDSIAVLQYTSGSTTDPRGVMLTHGNVLSNLAAIRRATGQGPSAVGVAWLPLYHDMGLIGSILFPIYAGFPATLMSPMSFLRRPLRWLELISELRATVTPAPNFGYELCVRAFDRARTPVHLDLSSLEIALNGAEFVRPSTLMRFAERFQRFGFRPSCFQPCYGLAEAALMVTSAPSRRGAVVRPIDVRDGRGSPGGSGPRQRAGRALDAVSCGAPAAETRVVIADPSSGVACASGCIGEILVAGPSVAKGYWRRPGETAEVFGFRLADGSGPYMRTGDLGVIHEGELYVVGRIKDMLVIDGRNLYPCDIEQTIATAAPELAGERSCMIALSDPASLVMVQEVDRGRPNPDELAATLRDVVSSSHQVSVSAVVLVERGSLPLTSSGKVRRFETEERLARGELKIVAQWSRAMVTARFAEHGPSANR